MKFNLGLMTLALILGLGLGYMFGQKQQPTPLSGPQAGEIQVGFEKLQGLTENDFAEYYRLKTLEERYLKADEILAKIVKIFLADLGMRMNP